MQLFPLQVSTFISKEAGYHSVFILNMSEKHETIYSAQLPVTIEEKDTVSVDIASPLGDIKKKKTFNKRYWKLEGKHKHKGFRKASLCNTAALQETFRAASNISRN